MTLNEIWAAARPRLAPKCRACPVCDGRACRGEIPGCGAMGDGSSWTACTEFLARVKLRMDTLHECWKPDASAELFGVKLAAPLCLAPIGGMAHNYNNAITAALTRASSPIKLDASTAYIAQAYNMLSVHMVLVIISAALVALLPVYSKLLKKINVSVEVEDNGSMAEIELND